MRRIRFERISKSLTQDANENTEICWQMLSDLIPYIVYSGHLQYSGHVVCALPERDHHHCIMWSPSLEHRIRLYLGNIYKFHHCISVIYFLFPTRPEVNPGYFAYNPACYHHHPPNSRGKIELRQKCAVTK